MQRTPVRIRYNEQVWYSIVAIIALVAAGCLLITPAAATPPSAVILSYNEQASELSVTISHPVADPTTHYIREVVITVNGKTIKDTPYTSQPSADTFTYTYPLQTKPGDDIEVTANCNLAGSKSSHLYLTTTTAPAAAVPGTTIPPTQKAAAGLVPVLGAVAIFLAGKKE
ncbi:hypothetical protein [uncultured Methanoregula sp.]|uniref:hypothetical protein n=1 Tax=uncultured Methanoregula sp. TaxID=1005933 RepID=UPI002AABCD7F|nr:hypothetical protein [uncultured Methanoregula sp.]